MTGMQCFTGYRGKFELGTELVQNSVQQDLQTEYISRARTRSTPDYTMTFTSCSFDHNGLLCIVISGELNRNKMS